MQTLPLLFPILPQSHSRSICYWSHLRVPLLATRELSSVCAGPSIFHYLQYAALLRAAFLPLSSLLCSAVNQIIACVLDAGDITSSYHLPLSRHSFQDLVDLPAQPYSQGPKRTFFNCGVVGLTFHLRGLVKCSRTSISKRNPANEGKLSKEE